MRTSLKMALFFLLGLWLTSCSSVSTPTPSLQETSIPVCGDGVCGILEDPGNCAQDCPSVPAAGRTLTTFVSSEGVGNIAIQVSYPHSPRYAEGAGVVVLVSPFTSDIGGFLTEPDLASIGLIQVSYLWPGKVDSLTRVQSEGQFDYGGPSSIQVLRDVIRFALGRQSDINGRSITTLLPITPLIEEVGLYAFSNAGMAAVNVLALYGDDLGDLQYYIGRETPTEDVLASPELGHYDENGTPVQNPFYLYPTSYTPHKISLNYGTLRWDAEYTDSRSGFVGRPYLDLDANEQPGTADYLFSGPVPQMFGKRYYSIALTQALLDLGVLTEATWPADLATPSETIEAWGYRQENARYEAIGRLQDAGFKVMLVFARNEHAQVAIDKPHIHQAYQGFRYEAQPPGAELRWVRLNPDRAYVQQFLPTAGAGFPDNPANTAPSDWLEIRDWAYPGEGISGSLVPLAAVAEMADRAHAGRWDENLGSALYTFIPPTPTP